MTDGTHIEIIDGGHFEDANTDTDTGTPWEHTVNYGFPVRQGWQCPLCGRVYSPDVKHCDCARGEFVPYPPEPWRWPGYTTNPPRWWPLYPDYVVTC